MTGTAGGAPVTLAPDTGRLPSYDGVTAAGRARADQLLARHPAVSLHDHPVRLPDPLASAVPPGPCHEGEDER